MIAYFAIDLMVCAMMSEHRSMLGEYRVKLNRGQKRMLFRLLGAACALVLLITANRHVDTNFLAEAYRYFCGAMTQFDVRLHSFLENPVYTHGYTSFRGFIMPIGVILKKIIGFDYSDTYVYAASIGSELQEKSVLVGPQVWMKVFVTLFYFFYVDGGFPAVILLSALYGFFANRMFLRAKAEPNGRNLAIFAFFMQGIFMSMVRIQFYIPGYAWGLLVIIFSYRRGGRKNEYLSAPL
ncbi:MAG: oligosaccharide repeat unit polymerase [Oscillibacter sp.]|nr:oligosaccharide repeat unit polymerase [Oscillibacter sp.]